MKRLAEDFEFLDVDIIQWTNLLSSLPLFHVDRGVLNIIYRANEIIYAVHSERGEREYITGHFSRPDKIVQELHERENVDAVVMLDQDLPSYLLAKVQAMFFPDVDFLNLLEMAKEAFETELGRRLHIWPPEFWTSNILSIIHNLHRLMASLPKDLLFLLVAFQENKIWSSFIIQIQGGQLKRITTANILQPLKKPIVDWREDYRLLLDKMKEQIGRPTIGLFIDDEALRFLFRSNQPIDFIRQARRTGQIILDPLPSQLKRRL